MRKLKNKFLLLLLVTLLLIFTGCGKSALQKTELTIAAAADLTSAFTELGQNFEKATNSKVVFSFGSTGNLAEQIQNGAPFDVFAAANVKVIEELKEKNLILPDTQQLYAIGRIGTATPISSSLQIKDLKDLLSPEIKKIAIANPDHAPYGLAAKQALEAAGLWEQVKDKLVYGKNIQDTLTLILTGNADTGIIALSIAKKKEVDFQIIDDGLHKPLKQAIAVIKGTKNEKLSRKFIDYVNGEEGRTIMKKYGFVLPGEAK